MLKKFLNFIKYHNAAVVILGVILLLGTSVFASETGREALGGKQTKIEGADNSVLLATDLGAFNMDFKIEKIEQQADKYFVSFTCVDLVKSDNVWQYQSKEKQLKLSLKYGENDLATVLTKELKDIYQSRVRDLKTEQAKARENGIEKRTEVTEYSGLIGKTLDLAGQVFPGYSSVSKKELPLAASLQSFDGTGIAAEPRNANLPGAKPDLTEIYRDYLIEAGSITGSASTTADQMNGTSTPGLPENDIGSFSPPLEPEKVEVIDLTQPSASPTPSENTPTPTD